MVRAALKPSRLLSIGLAVVHLGAAATLQPLDLPLAAKLAAAAVIAASLCRSVWRYALLRGKDAVIALEIQDQENGAICRSDGTWEAAKILGTSYVTPRLTVVNVRTTGARFASHVLLTTDNVSEQDFRQVRVLLRWARPKSVAVEDGPVEL